MNESFFSLRPILCAALLLVLSAGAGAETPSLAFKESLFYPESHELRISGRSAMLDGFALIKNPGPISRFSPELYSFGFSAMPLPAIGILAGSIHASGFPSRARSPVFSLYTPFYVPTAETQGSLLKTGETRSTRNAAVELSLRSTKVAALANLGPESAEPSWLLLSHSVPAFDPDDASVSVSFLGSSRIRPASGTADDSWFLADISRPQARSYTPGMEIIAKRGDLSASCAGFLETGALFSPAGAVRADAALTLSRFSAAAGMYRADPDFRDMDGTRNGCLGRTFAAGAVTFPGEKASGAGTKWGVLLVSDTLRREKYCESDTSSIWGGTGIELAGKQARIRLQLMKKTEETEMSGKMVIYHFPHPSLKVETGANSTRTALSEGQKIENTLSLALTAAPTRRFSGNLSASCGKSTSAPGMKYSVSASAGYSLEGRKTDWNLGAKITRQNTGEPLAGGVSVGFTLR